MRTMERMQGRVGEALLITDHGGVQRVVDVKDSSLLIGRHRDADVRLDHITVSLRHAEVYRDDGGALTIVDLGSLNGVTVNGRRVFAARLEAGDDVRVGACRFWVAGRSLAAAS